MLYGSEYIDHASTCMFMYVGYCLLLLICKEWFLTNMKFFPVFLHGGVSKGYVCVLFTLCM